MSKGAGLVKSRERFVKMIELVPERAEFYRGKILECDDKIIELGCCKRCGRILKSEEARTNGYGKECLSKTEERSDNRTDRVRPERERHGGELPGGEGVEEVSVC